MYVDVIDDHLYFICMGNMATHDLSINYDDDLTINPKIFLRFRFTLIYI